jgi:hypothetical protein
MITAKLKQILTDSGCTLVLYEQDKLANGFYVLAVVTSATMATSAHCHISACLQIRNN